MRKLSQSISNFYVKYGSKSSEDKRISDLTYKINLIVLITGIFYSIVFLLLNQPLLSGLGWCISTGLLGCFLAHKKGHHLVSKLGIIAITNIAVLFYSVVLGDESGISIFFFALVGIPFVIFHFRELKWIKLAVSFSVILWIFSQYQPLTSFGHFPNIYLDGIKVLTGIMTFFILLSGLVSYLISNEFYKIKSNLSLHRLGKTNLKLDNTITKLTQETQEKEAALIREQKKAKTIKTQSQKIKTDAIEIEKKKAQERLLKQAGNYQTILFQDRDKIPQPKGQKITVFGSASHHITGDYRYVFQINPHTSAIMALDVTGHGAPAAMMTGVLSKIVDDLFETSDPQLLMDTGKTMEVLNKTLYTERRLDKFVAGVYAVIDTVNKMIYVCCAGAETVVILRDNKIIAIKNSNESLRMDEYSKFISVMLSIQSGDRILVCTDGLMDRKLKDGSHLFTPIEAEGDYDEDAGEYPEIYLDYTKFEFILTNLPKDNSFAESLGNTLNTLCLPASDDMTIVAVEIT